MEPVFIMPRRPLWVDRQMIAAADLTAEQDWQDAQRARLRRFALGWGVVAGFEVIKGGDGLRIKKGYGLTPMGHEIYLPDDLNWEGIGKDLRAACHPSAENACSDLSGQSSDGESGAAWIVARLVDAASCPRPGVPEGCAHAGNHWAYTRNATGVQFEICCNLDPAMLLPASDCDEAAALLKEGAVPMPDDLDFDVLPIAAIQFGSDGIETVTVVGRRRLLPMSLLQDALACCSCHETEPVEPTDPVIPTEPDGTIWDKLPDGELGDVFADFGGFFVDPEFWNFVDINGVFKSESFKEKVDNAGLALPIFKSFASAQLVTDQDQLSLWLKGEYLELYKTSLKAGEVEKFNGMALSDIWMKSHTREVLSNSQISGIPIREFLTWENEKIMEAANTLDFDSAANLFWMHSRLLVLVKERK